MSATIHLLSEHTINQIAAGEVIENPASIIKELVENSIDAGSTKVIVETLGGGLQLIRISDDGVGMGPQDALLCLERHATSKIREAEDLSKISTMGFRGEALASIAAISKMTIQTCLADGVGTEVEVEAGVIQQVKPCARNKGTTIEVRQLFYNVPARRKFQKSAAVCSADITRVLTSLSLAHPLMGFELYQQNQENLKLLKESGDFLEALRRRIGNVLGEPFLEESIAIESSFSPFAFKGFLGGIQNTRPNRSLQHAFINQRAVHCPALSFAVKDALGTRIAEDRFPIYVLHLEIPFEFLDVNVHPQKREVRLREEKWIKQKIQEKIQEELFAKEKKTLFSPLSTETVSFNLFSSESFFAKPEIEPVNSLEENFFIKPQGKEQFIQSSLEIEKTVVPIGLYDHFLWIDAATTFHLGFGIESQGIWIVDLKAATSRILFNSLAIEEKPSVQALLLPLSFSCSLAEAQQILTRQSQLEKIGFSLRSSGRQSFLVEAIPSLLKEEESLDFLRQFISTEEKEEHWNRMIERRLASACSRQVSLRKERYFLSGALDVLQALSKTKDPLFCPLGNKTIIQLGKDELQQFFTKKR